MIYQTENLNIIYECMQNVESFNLYINGKIEKISKQNKKYMHILNNVKEVFCQARIMPAFSVSLHNDTLEELKSHVWLEINFASEQMVNDLNFTALLFKIEQTTGINLVRKHNNKYEGRCIYLDFLEEHDLRNILFN